MSQDCCRAKALQIFFKDGDPMDNQRNGPDRDIQLNEELADVLTAISVVAKHLAMKIRAKNIGENDNGNKD